MSRRKMENKTKTNSNIIVMLLYPGIVLSTLQTTGRMNLDNKPRRWVLVSFPLYR